MHCQPYHFLIRVRKECFGNFVASSTFPLPRKAKRIFSPPFRTTRYRTPLRGTGFLLVTGQADFVLQLFQLPLLDLDLRLRNQGRRIHGGMTFEAKIASGLLRHAGAGFPAQIRDSRKPLRAATARQPLIALWGCWHDASLCPCLKTFDQKRTAKSIVLLSLLHESPNPPLFVSLNDDAPPRFAHRRVSQAVYFLLRPGRLHSPNSRSAAPGLPRNSTTPVQTR